MPERDAGSDGEACAGCDRSLGWIDSAAACPNGCVLCAECAADAGGNCPSCGEPLARRSAKARPLPGR